MKQIIKSLLIIVAVASVAGGATWSQFTSEEAVAGNTFSAGTLELELNNDPVTTKFEVSDVKPGYDSGYKVWCLKNTGSLPGQPYVEYSDITNTGELGQYMKYVIGVGPCNWSVPSLLISQWQTGPAHPWGTPGLNALGGNEYFKGPSGYKFPVLKTGETYGFFMKISIDEDVKTYTGTSWKEFDDNDLQGDKVDFDITFHLDQI